MAQQTRPTQPGKLSDVARHVVLPTGIESTGWPAVRDTCRSLGVEFDPWQDGAGRAILAKRSDGQYACSIGGAVISIPRQVGKTFLLGAIVFALCLLNPGLTVIWTAHRARTAGETFTSMRAFCKRKKVAPHIEQVVLGSGDEAILFRNGSRVLFGARERGFGLGFANVGVLVLDEAQRLSDTAVDDMIPTMNQAANPLPLFTGTPPRPTDAGEVFTRKRAAALSGEDTDTLFIEFSADREAKPDDRRQWAKANPSYPRRTNEAAILRMKKNLTPESFLREALGIWDEEFGEGEIPRWVELADKRSTIASGAAWALAVSPLELGPQWACFGLAGFRADGRLHVEALDHRAGTWWVKDRAKELYEKHWIPLRMRPTGGENGLIASLREAGIEVEEVSANDVSQAFGAFIAAAGFDEAGMPLMHHPASDRHPTGDPDLNRAVRRAKKRTTAGGSSVWDELRSSMEITPLVAVTVALGGATADVDPLIRF
jgi:hypothetical protein